jgi:Tfp pilus assembly pilus retraction ATPase PilT
MDTLNEIKFSHPTVVKAVREIFGSSEYRKVLVVWEIEDESVIEQAKSRYRIEVWKMSDIMSELMREVKTKAYRDDVLRTIQHISRRVSNSRAFLAHEI